MDIPARARHMKGRGRTTAAGLPSPHEPALLNRHWDNTETIVTIDLETLETSARKLVEAARAAGADSCDVVVAKGQSLGVSVREGEVENTNRSEGDGFSLRVFVGARVAAVSTNQPSDFDSLAERAVAMAKASPEDPHQGLADPDLLARDWPDMALSDPSRPDAESLGRTALEAEQAGIAVKGVSRSMGASAGWGMSGFVLATSHGFSGHFSRTGHSVSAAMVSGEGEAMERDYDFSSAVFEEDLLPAAEIGRTAGERAVRRASPRQVKSASLPVIFDRRIASGILGALLGAINGQSVARKTSFLRDRMNEMVANRSVSVFDDPFRPRGLGSRPFDGEGVAMNPMTLVDSGRLETWLLDSASGRELGLPTNGRASRGGSSTHPSATNAWIAAGAYSPGDLMREAGTGLLVTETIGHGVNMVTGDYSKGASGFWFENGEIAYPVSGVTIAGNLRDMFLSMTPASDLEFKGSVNAPSLLVTGMTIGGE